MPETDPHRQLHQLCEGILETEDLNAAGVQSLIAWFKTNDTNDWEEATSLKRVLIAAIQDKQITPDEKTQLMHAMSQLVEKESPANRTSSRFILYVVGFGVCLLILAILFPPWREEVLMGTEVMDIRESKRLGSHYLFIPPSRHWAGQLGRVVISWGEYVARILAIIVGTILGVYVLSGRDLSHMRYRNKEQSGGDKNRVWARTFGWALATIVVLAVIIGVVGRIVYLNHRIDLSEAEALAGMSSADVIRRHGKPPVSVTFEREKSEFDGGGWHKCEIWYYRGLGGRYYRGQTQESMPFVYALEFDENHSVEKVYSVDVSPDAVGLLPTNDQILERASSWSRNIMVEREGQREALPN